MKWLLPTAALGAGCLAYGALFEVDRLVAERVTLPVPRWPLPGFRIGFFADLHVQDRTTMALAMASAEWLVEESPDIIVIGGDFVPFWKDERADMLRFCLAPLLAAKSPVLAVPGNRDHRGEIVNLSRICADLGIDLLRNQSVCAGGVRVVGLDSFAAGRAVPSVVASDLDSREPTVLLLHEPDPVDQVPTGAHLALAGHSHGGQFLAPWGWAPKKTKLGEKYVRGYYPHARTPLYVTRGLGTTGPPSRLFCPPEVAVLTLVPS